MLGKTIKKNRNGGKTPISSSYAFSRKPHCQNWGVIYLGIIGHAASGAMAVPGPAVHSLLIGECPDKYLGADRLKNTKVRNVTSFANLSREPTMGFNECFLGSC
jgi:hypothetical protein